MTSEPEQWAALKTRLEEAGVDYQSESGTSIYFRDSNGARLELIADPLGEMYGTKVPWRPEGERTALLSWPSVLPSARGRARR